MVINRPLLEWGFGGKRVVNFWRGGLGFLEIAINFTLKFLLVLLFTCRLKDVVSLVILQ